MVGLTDCDVFVDGSAYVLPSLPVITTCVAFALTTFNVDALPAVIEAGSDVRVTVGGGFGVTVTVTVAATVPPAPVAVAV